ncbi:MAG: hypothetical protein V4489_02275 [Chlamydiota bacterium]
MIIQRLSKPGLGVINNATKPYCTKAKNLVLEQLEQLSSKAKLAVTAVTCLGIGHFSSKTSIPGNLMEIAELTAKSWLKNELETKTPEPPAKEPPPASPLKQPDPTSQTPTSSLITKLYNSQAAQTLACGTVGIALLFSGSSLAALPLGCIVVKLSDRSGIYGHFRDYIFAKLGLPITKPGKEPEIKK